MKFRGNHEFTGYVSSKNVIVETDVKAATLTTPKFVIDANGSSAKNSPIRDVLTPISNTDAANKEYVDLTRVKVTMRETTPDFAGETISGKDGDILLVGTPPGRIQISDLRVYGKPVSDLDSDGTNIYALVQDANNSVAVSSDGGFSWKYQSSTFSNAENAKFGFKYLSTSGDKLFAWREYMSPTHKPLVSSDNGVSWSELEWFGGPPYDAENTKWLPARRSRGVSTDIYFVNMTPTPASASVMIYRYKDAFSGVLPQPMPGVTMNTPAVSAASHGERCLIISAAGEVLRRWEDTRTTRFDKGGTLPQAGVLWSDIVAIDQDTFIACAGSGVTQPTWCYTTNFGSSWQIMTTAGTAPNFKGIHYNTTNNTIVTLGDKVAYIGTGTFPNITWVKTGNYSQTATQSVTPFGIGFVAASAANDIFIYGAGPNWVNQSNGGFTELYFNKDQSWPKYIPEFDDANYLKLSGGKMNGTIVMSETARLVGISATPLQNDEAVSKAYVDALLDKQAKTMLSQNKTVHGSLFSIYNEVECIKMTIMAKDADTTKAGRYYSEVVMVLDPKNTKANGAIKPEYTEYAVISTGDLQVTDIAITDLFAPFGNATLSVTTNRNTDVTIIYQIIDF